MERRGSRNKRTGRKTRRRKDEEAADVEAEGLEEGDITV